MKPQSAARPGAKGKRRPLQSGTFPPDEGAKYLASRGDRGRYDALSGGGGFAVETTDVILAEVDLAGAGMELADETFVDRVAPR